jgi:hypothetical protein
MMGVRLTSTQSKAPRRRSAFLLGGRRPPAVVAVSPRPILQLVDVAHCSWWHGAVCELAVVVRRALRDTIGASEDLELRIGVDVGLVRDSEKSDAPNLVPRSGTDCC